MRIGVRAMDELPSELRMEMYGGMYWTYLPCSTQWKKVHRSIHGEQQPSNPRCDASKPRTTGSLHWRPRHRREPRGLEGMEDCRRTGWIGDLAPGGAPLSWPAASLPVEAGRWQPMVRRERSRVPGRASWPRAGRIAGKKDGSWGAKLAAQRPVGSRVGRQDLSKPLTPTGLAGAGFQLLHLPSQQLTPTHRGHPGHSHHHQLSLSSPPSPAQCCPELSDRL